MPFLNPPSVFSTIQVQYGNYTNIYYIESMCVSHMLRFQSSMYYDFPVPVNLSPYEGGRVADIPRGMLRSATQTGFIEWITQLKKEKGEMSQFCSGTGKSRRCFIHLLHRPSRRYIHHQASFDVSERENRVTRVCKVERSYHRHLSHPRRASQCCI